MEKLIDAFLEFPQEWQIAFVAAILLIGLIIVINVFRTIRVLFRGYPPEPKQEVKECNLDGNLTGKCLKVGGCRTQAECDRMLKDQPKE